MTQTKTSPVLVDRRGAVDWVTLNRPERLNALDDEMTHQLRVYFDDLYRDRDCRVVVLQGAGRAFCAGLDLSSAQAERFMHDGIPNALDVQRDIRDIMLAMKRCPQPVISLLHGAVAGGGFVLALASDIRFAATDTTMNAAFVRIGLGGCDVGASYLLPRLIGASAAADILFTGRDVSAERAHQLGLLTEVVDPSSLHESGCQTADLMLATAPEALRMTKQVFNANLDAPSFQHALALEDRNQVLLGQMNDFKEGVEAFREKRKAEFSGD